MLTAILLTNNVISPHQHGFLSKKSTTTQLLECSYDWCVALTSGLNVDVAYLDYAKAFDSVVHSKLLAKLSHYGASGSVLKWIEKFLINRCQCVRVRNVLFTYADVVSGVGSVLGPVLFIVFIDDMCRPNCIPGSTVLKLLWYQL